MSKPQWECPNCNEINDLDPAVVDLCSEVWESFQVCKNRYKFNLSGESA